MRPTLDNSKYPVFEANQVLTNRHLNQVFNYLNEQERLTRANLIGIGIVCGLELEIGGSATAPTVRIRKGCGITSEGYLIVEPADVDLVSYRIYTPPTDLPYPPFTGAGPLLEMFPSGEPDTTLFSDEPANFLDDKVVMLFLELKKEGLRNCSPINCDDRGAEVYVTLRRLLVNRNDPKITRLIDGTATTGSVIEPVELNDRATLSIADLEFRMFADLNLADIRLPRYSVPASALTTSNTVLGAYASLFRVNLVAKQVGEALKNAYAAFEPVLKEIYPTNPFTGFAARYGFLDSGPQNAIQVRFLQYYYDLFDDLIKAYDEFRWTGAELMCACCPSESLFPRHLLLGLLRPELSAPTDPRIFRHYFMASAAIGDCEERTVVLQQMFRRLVEMTERFSNEPPLFMGRGPANLQQQIRITPGKLGDFPLSEKCIPYYYLQNGTPQLFHLWNAEKSRRKRAHYNLSYRSFEYDISLPDFVSDPLRFDLEPHNFLRIEGHLGKDYIQVLTALQEQKNRYRLPIDIIALRTGAFDENMVVDVSKETCRFEDLESLYATTREQWMGQLCNDLTYLYEVQPLPATIFKSGLEETPVEKTKETLPEGSKVSVDDLATADPGTIEKVTAVTKFPSKYSLINIYAAGYLVQSDKLGGLYEKNISISDPWGINARFLELFKALLDLADALPQTLGKFDLKVFEIRLKTMLQAAFRLENLREDPRLTSPIKDTPGILLWEEIDDRIEHLKFGFRSDAIKSISDEYVRRIKEVKQKQFLSNFLVQHPGIQHKAGVPLGGTFILVYHDAPDKVFPDIDPKDYQEAQLVDETIPNISGEAIAADKDYAARSGRSPVFTPEFEEAFKRLQLNEAFVNSDDFRIVQGAMTGYVSDPKFNYDLLLDKDANQVIAQFLSTLPDRAIIADFFLPYLCCSDCAGVQYVLPPTLPTFTYTIFCTDANNRAEVAIIPEGGTPSYSYKVGNQDFTPIGGKISLEAGTHTLRIRDAAGTESAPQTLVIQPKISATTPVYKCKDDLTSYTVEFIISGGTPPYTANLGNIDTANKYLSNPIKNGTSDKITVLDSRGCSLVVPVSKTCAAPLEFSATPKCTSAEDLQAPIELQIKGGVAPYQLQVDTGTFAAIPERLRLPVGNHTLTLRDKNDTKKTVTFNVADPLRALVSASDGYSCNKARTEYMVKIAISGGKKPYSVNGAEVKADPFVYGPVASGKSETLKISDSAGCETLLPITYKCRVLPAFDVALTPTDRKGEAQLTLIPREGVEPFSYRLNDGDFQPLKGPVSVRAGRYTIVLKDKEEMLSEPKTIEVPQAEPGCDKPCAGISRKCSYRLWIQPSPGKFEIYKPGEVSFTFTDEKGKTQNIPDISIDALPEMLNKDFHGVVGALVKQMNDRVAKAIGPNRLVLSYEPGDNDPFARLWVEYFQCESFNFKFQVDYAQGNQRLKEYEVNYLKAGDANAVLFTNLQLDSAPLRIDAFDCTVRDQCKDTAAEPVCKGVSTRLAFRASQDGDKLTLNGLSGGIGTNGISIWVWSIENAPEPFYTGQNLTLPLAIPPEGITVKLTGINRMGCFMSSQQKIMPQK